MKVIKIGLIALLPVSLFGAGCPTTPLSPLVGSWSGKQTVPDCSCSSFETSATFNADGTATLLNFPGIPLCGITLLVNYETSGNQLTIVTNSLVGTVVDTYSITGNTLSVTAASCTMSLTRQ